MLCVQACSVSVKNHVQNISFEKEDIYLRPVAAHASLVENQINLTSLVVCVTVDTLIKGVAVHVIFVDAVRLPATEIISRCNSCGGSFGSGRYRRRRTWII